MFESLFKELVEKYDPDQPRAPAGEGGGRWVSHAAAHGHPATTLAEKHPALSLDAANKVTDNLLATLDPHHAAGFRELSERGKALIPTSVQHSRNGDGTGGYTAQRLEVHKQVLADIFKNTAYARPAPGEKPQLMMLAGRAGAGKTEFGTSLGKYDATKFIRLDTDMIKERLAHLDGQSMIDSTGKVSVGWRAHQYHEESSRVFDRAQLMARKMGLNIVMDVTMNSAHTERLQAFKRAGYTVKGYMMYLSPEKAALRSIQRTVDNGSMNGRLVDPTYVLMKDGNFEKSFERNLPKFDYWEIWSNDVPRGHKPVLLSTKNKARKSAELRKRVMAI